MNRILHTLRPWRVSQPRGRKTAVSGALFGLLLTAGLNLISPSPGAAHFLSANRIVVVCSLLGEPPLTTTISADQFCEIAKTAIESLARGKVGPRVLRFSEWQRGLEAIWPKACDENRPPEKAAEYCYPTARDLSKPRPYLQVTIERFISPKNYSDPTVLVIRFPIRLINIRSKEVLVFSYNLFLENSVADERNAKILQRITRYPGGVVLSGGTIPTQELFDGIQFTLANEFTPFVLNRINLRAAPP